MKSVRIWHPVLVTETWKALGGVTNQEMSLNETCFCLGLYGIGVQTQYADFVPLYYGMAFSI